VLVWDSCIRLDLLQGGDGWFQRLSGAACVTRSDHPDLLGLCLTPNDLLGPKCTTEAATEATTEAPAAIVPRENAGNQEYAKLLRAIRSILEESAEHSREVLSAGFASAATNEDLRALIDSDHRHDARLLSAQRLRALLTGESMKVSAV
jgi:hypothetical protein